MKILCSFLLIAGSVVCKGQVRLAEPADFQVNFSGMTVFVPGRMDSVRVMRPDHMVCLVPNVAKVEPMPVKRVYNGDRMAVRLEK